ncbi:helix-turn-helix domain-containing protein [Microvirga pudoricolor]|uniref:helix-turn-helix domain-containing protein n=1 Tax=Microvirga pudoricolor TaxID=2778729 RepID=UPI001950BE2C|nr:helix-turn-helix transcriptional regulator [Microvirga pudoricolor]MBM6595466.1 helix-turn-helix transcriptional regulator [Microvirga pudoricolor]
MPTTKSPSALDQFIGQRIRTARVAKGMSQEGLADQLGLTFQQLQKYEKGVNRITAGRLEEISRVLGCPLLWLYGKDEDVGILPTPHQVLAERIGLLSPPQQAALKQMTDAMLNVAGAERPEGSALRSGAPKRGRPRKEALKARSESAP